MKPPPKGVLAVCSLAYWQQYFKIDAKELRSRLGLVLLPNQTKNLSSAVKETPDLYGPVWITGLIIFITMLSASLIPILSRIFLDSVPGSLNNYSLNNLGYLCGFLYAMLFVYPSIYSIILKASSTTPEEKFSNMSSICLQGYCNLPFVLGSVLCVINNRLWRFFVLLICGLYSAASMFMAYSHLSTTHRLVISLLGRSIIVLVLFFAY